MPLFVFAFMFSFVLPPQAQSQQAAGLFSETTTPQGAPPQAPRATVMRQRLVNINFEQMRATLPASLGGPGGGLGGGPGASQTLDLNLFPDAQFVAVRNRIEITDTGYVWVGEIENLEPGAVTLAVNGTVMQGNVTAPNGSYAIRFTPGGAHVIEQVDLNAFPPELPPIEPELVAAADQPPVMSDDGSLIDLIVVYTPLARTSAGGTSAMQSLIDLGVSETNQAYTNSGAIQRIRLMRKEEIAYVESGSMSTDLVRLQSTSDGHMDSVHSLRNTYAADLTQLIVNSPESCGIAYVQSTVSNTFAPFAFGVTHYPCISPNYSFAHEMGHNMGLAHDTYPPNQADPAFAYGHGYVNQAAFVGGAPTNKRWRTIMAYNDQCLAVGGFNCTRLLYFSNPLNTFTSDPMGNAVTADAVHNLDNTRVTVSNFRTATTPLDNFSNAREIFTSPFADSLNTVAFTSEGTDPTPSCGNGSKLKSAWYRFTPAVPGSATVDTFGSTYNTILSVYTGTTGSFVSVGCNDDASATVQSQLTFAMAAGVTYSIMLTAFNGDGGTLTLNLTAPILKKRKGQTISD